MTVERNDIKIIRISDFAGNFYYDTDTAAWIFEPDDEDEEAVILQSQEHSFEEITILGKTLDETMMATLIEANNRP